MPGIRRAPSSPGVHQPGWPSDVLLGLLGLLVAGAAAWVPSTWLDEAATANISSYPLADQALLWTRTDFVYAPYYVLMHGWLGLVGTTSPLILRAPSVLAAGIGTGAMACAGRIWGGRGHQIAFAACYALLPRTTAMAVNARPYELSSMCVALVLAALVAIHERPRWWLQCLCVVFCITAVLFQLFAVLPLAVVLGVSAALEFQRHRYGSIVVGTLWALACLPFAMRARGQQSQISWIAGSDYNLADQGLVESWFTTRWTATPDEHSAGLHYLAVGLAAVAAITVICALVRGQRERRAALAAAAAPVVFAVGTLWGLSLVRSPILLGRYLTPTAPCTAALLALALMTLRPRLRAFIAVLLCASCLVIIGAQRLPGSRVPSEDYGFLASTIREHSSAGDGLLIENGQDTSDSARNAIVCYPKDFADLEDIAQPSRPPLAHVFALDAPIVDLATEQGLPERIWVIANTSTAEQYPQQLEALGYTPQEVYPGTGHIVTGWQRGQ